MPTATACRPHWAFGRPHVAHRRRPPGLRTKRVSKYRRLVRREVDHAVGDDHVDRVIRHRQVLYLAQPELDVRFAGCPRYLASLTHHLRGHVDPDYPAGLPDRPRSQKAVESRPGPQVEDYLPRLERRDGLRVAAAEAQVRALGRGGKLLCAVSDEVGDRIAIGDGARRRGATAGRACAAAARSPCIARDTGVARRTASRTTSKSFPSYPCSYPLLPPARR
jgi:hypothetical protein